MNCCPHNFLKYVQHLNGVTAHEGQQSETLTHTVNMLLTYAKTDGVIMRIAGNCAKHIHTELACGLSRICINDYSSKHQERFAWSSVFIYTA